ncbi:MAG TPA: hypothetical protein VMQ73_09010 [Methylomirabilota bacterium]|nr:hypothetical protein [Methylomirabilota bacterium]
MHPSSSGAASRRHLLRVALGAAAGALAGLIARPAPRAAAGALFRDRPSAERIGRRYLASLTAEPDRNAILAASPRLDRALAAPVEQTARQLRQAIAVDFRHGDVAVVDGWVLAKSEAHLCALVALG